jgi:tetratricopeptide (TPR) repeat protein
MNLQIRDFKLAGLVVLLLFALACNEKEKPGPIEKAQTTVTEAPNKSADASKALEINPQSAAEAYNLCVSYAKGNWKQAAPLCQKAWKLEPGNPKYAYTLAFYGNHHGQRSEAIKVLETIIKDNPANASVYTLLAMIYQQKSQKEKAQAVYRAGAANTNLPPAERARFAGQLP